ncbi:TetR/AcrR family transcriptional regulator [Streptomyces sp. URMC 129]|uniref:TetR/AcrR family transcriptional regulator n=1 Tax=Streptomyces sp. URMC 129 TaxID=3423407 RepID=UPI003F1AF66C
MTEKAVRQPGAGRARTRLDTERRREQLLRVGVQLFAERPYEEVWIEQVAELASVSRGLLYHYFPTKRDFFLAVVRREGERILGMTATDPGLPMDERLLAGLDVYLRFAEEHSQGYRAFHRAMATGDPEIRAIYQELLDAQAARIVAALEPAQCLGPDALRTAVRGWLSFVTTVCLDWLENRRLTRDEVRDLCARALLGAVGG